MSRFRRSARRSRRSATPTTEGEGDRVERELGRRRDELAEVVRDRVVRLRRLAEVAVHEVARGSRYWTGSGWSSP